jgi:hypothetical protein
MSAASVLETRYRRAVRAYPAGWRARHGEELIGVMLDVAAAEGRTKPATRELAHLVLHGAGARVNRFLSVIPPRRRNRVAAIGTIAGTAVAMVLMVLGELGRWSHPNTYTSAGEGFGPFTTPAAIVFLLAIGAFLALAAGRNATAKILHGLVIAASISLLVILGPADPAIPVRRLVFAFFAATSLLAMLGNPTRTIVLRRTVLFGAPALGVFLILTSYLQVGGVQKPFYGDPHFYNDAVLAFQGLKLVAIAVLIAIAGSKVRPWACLLLLPLTARPLISLFAGIGGDPIIGRVGIPFDAFYILCCTAALVSAWAAWKRPTVTFPGKPTEPSPR